MRAQDAVPCGDAKTGAYARTGKLRRELRAIPGRSVDVVLEKADSGAARDTNENHDELQEFGGGRANVFCEGAAEKTLGG